MARRFIPLARLIACLGAAWQPYAAFGQEEDVQLWVYATAEGSLDDDTRLAVDFSARWREQAREDEQQTLRFNIEQQIGRGVRLGGGFGVFEAGGLTELRPHQEMTLSAGRFAARTRIEQRFFDGADRMELRFRQRLRYTQPIADRLSAGLDGEYFHLVQTRDRGPDQPRDQWRARVLVQYRLRDSLRLGAGYLIIYTPQPAEPDQFNHVPQAIVTYRF